MTSRDYSIHYMDGVTETFPAITRTQLDTALHLYRRERPGDAEVHVASLPLTNVRKWVKTP